MPKKGSLRRAIAAGGLALALPLTVAASQSTADAARASRTAYASIRSFDFGNGTTQGWTIGRGPATVANTTAVAFPGTTHSLAITLLGKGMSIVKSPGPLTGIRPGSTISYHLYAPAGTTLEVDPFVVFGWEPQFIGPHRLAAGAWKTIVFSVPDIASRARYLGFEIENRAGIETTIDLGAVRLGRAISRHRLPPPTTTTTTTATTSTAPSAGGPTPDGPSGSWKLVFDDEFNGTSLDTSKWSPDWFESGGNMNNVGTYASNVTVADGVVSLKLASPTSGALISTNPNGGAGHGFQYTYGYAEARIWFPGSGATVDNWPAFWTDGQNWPADGEIDVAEGLGTLTSNYHDPQGVFNSNTISGTWAAGWHTYGVDWEPGSLTVYWDGRVVHTLTSATTPITSSPQYLILNMGAGQGPTVVGASLQVDYVRVWQHS